MQMFSDMDGGNGIQKRAADDDVYDLGSKLHEKLEHKKEHMEEMYGNMTCMLRECQVLDSENKFYPEGIKTEWDEMKNKIEDDWLRSQLEKYCDQCIEFAVGRRDGQDQDVHEVHDEEEVQDLHAQGHQGQARGALRRRRRACEGDQDSGVRALRDCEADAEGTRDDDDGDELNDQKDQDHLNIQRSFKFYTNIGQDEDALPKKPYKYLNTKS